MSMRPKYLIVLVIIGLLACGCSQSRKSSPDRNSNTQEKSARTPTAVQKASDQSAPSQQYHQPPSKEKRNVHLAADRDTMPEESAVHRVTLEDVRMHVKNGTALLIDARSRESFAEGHVPGAINIPATNVEAEAPKQLRNVPRDQLLIIYCSSISCHSSDYLYEYLQTLGFNNMRVFSPGWMVLGNDEQLQ